MMDKKVEYIIKAVVYENGVKSVTIPQAFFELEPEVLEELKLTTIDAFNRPAVINKGKEYTVVHDLPIFGDANE